MTNDLLAGVIADYIKRGWSIFPLVPGGKIPATKNGFKDSTKSVEKALELFQIENCNIGITTGNISGIVVIDFDKKTDGLLTHDFLKPQLTETLTVKTGGGGLHLYYQMPPGAIIRNRTGLFQGVDVRGDGGYVVAPFSRTDGEYLWVNLDTPIAPLPDFLVKILTAPAATSVPMNHNTGSKLVGVKGQLSKSTLDFLVNGAPEGTWQNRIFKAAVDAKEQNYSKEEFSQMAEKITGHIDERDLNAIESAFSRTVKYGTRLTGNNSLKDMILACHLITDVRDTTRQVFVNFDTGTIEDIDPKQMFKKLSKDELKDYIKAQAIDARFEYNPHLNQPLHQNPSGLYIYNSYSPPNWKREHFFFGTPIPQVKTLPEIYDKFFRHLTNNHQPSMDYLLDWMANSLQRRNFTILTAIGEQGVGKGVLAYILEAIHGKDNFSLCTDTVFKEKFNAKLFNKTLVNVDEISLTDKASHDRVKAVVNGDIEIEKKGEDAITSRNHASFYITSNHLDAIRIGHEDRRYSVIQLTDKKMTETDLIDVIETEILNDVNLNHLAQYLYYRPIKSDMKTPFRSQRFEEMLEAGLNFWEEWFLEEFLPPYKGKDAIDLAWVQKEIERAGKLQIAPSRRKIENLQRRFPKRFVIERCGQGFSSRKIKVL